MNKGIPAAADSTQAQLPEYEAPKITLMDEKEVLKVFQITSAGVSWWVM